MQDTTDVARDVCPGQMRLFDIVDDDITHTWADDAKTPATQKNYMLVRAAGGVLSPDNWSASYATLAEARAEMRAQVAALMQQETQVYDDTEFDQKTGRLVHDFTAYLPDEDDYCLGDENDHAFFGACSGPEWQIFKIGGPSVPSMLDFERVDRPVSLADAELRVCVPGMRYVMSEPNVNVVPVNDKAFPWQAETVSDGQTFTTRAKTPEAAVKALWERLSKAGKLW